VGGRPDRKDINKLVSTDLKIKVGDLRLISVHQLIDTPSFILSFNEEEKCAKETELLSRGVKLTAINRVVRGQRYDTTRRSVLFKNVTDNILDGIIRDKLNVITLERFWI
jgi:hypothetical protein